MNPERHFLGWDAPATVKVQEFLLPQELSGPVQLAGDLIVVPTRQAGRHLRKALAKYCSLQHTALLSTQVVEPSYFLKPEDDLSSIANPLEIAAIWAEIMLNANIIQYNGLFPSHIPSQDFLWALRTGEIIQRLRKTLVDGGYSITTVYSDFKDILEEIGRWHDLAELEALYLERLSETGHRDPHAEMLRQVKNPQLQKGIDRIIVAAVPDPTPLMVHKMEQLSSQSTPITILIHAPESMSDFFDKWGRPIPVKWRERLISIPDPENNILLSGSPQLQSRKVIELIASEEGHFGPNDVAIGVPGNEIIPFLEKDLIENNLVSLNPAGRSSEGHPLSQLLLSFRDLVIDGDYPSVGAFLRNSDVLDYLDKKHHIPPDRLLEELDKYQNERLPQSLRHLVMEFKAGESSGTIKDEFPYLAKAIIFLEEYVQGFHETNAVNYLRSFLQSVYELRIIDSSKIEDHDFANVAEFIDEALHLISDYPIKQMNLDLIATLDILLWHLSGQKYYPEPDEEAIIDLEGWMELQWNDAPFLIVTGMNEGTVPKSRPDDIFLPDTLRRQLNLPHDENHLAVYTYQMAALIESHREQGRVCFIAGKTGSDGDTLKPSRLLLRCDDAELPGRARKLFDTPPEPPDNFPSDISFQLEASPPPDVPAYRLDMKSMAVTAFRDYLNCPFRFYLKRVLEMEPIDDLKTELDAMDFGSLVHDILYEMACNEEMRNCENVSRLQDFLYIRAEEWIKTRLGPLPPIQVEAQIESARQRMRQAAEVQVRLIKEGWDIISWEKPIQGYIDGFLIRGKIDRIDRHRKTGRIRVLDYKTSEVAKSPEKAHFEPLSKDVEYQDYVKVEINQRQRRWADLQLPLYAILLASEEELHKTYELGYFNLPKSVNDTGLALWEDFSPALLESAHRCARGVVSDIKNRRFWPPAANLRYDDFENLFPSDPALCVNTETFGMFMNRGRLL